MELDAAVGRLEAKLGAENLAHVGVVATGDALVDFPCGAVGQKLADLILGVEIGDGELHGLSLRQRFAKGDALLCVFADHLEATLRHAETMRGLMHAVARNPGLRLAHALPFFADEILGRHLHVVERNLVGDVAHHVMVLAQRSRDLSNPCRR